MNGRVLGTCGLGEARSESKYGSVYSLNPADCPEGSIFSLLVDIIQVKKNLGLGANRAIGINVFKCC